METTYSYEKKKRLAEKISKVKRKEDMVKIFEIIYQDNKNITENQNGLFMFFHKLNDSTYHKIDLFLRSTTSKKKTLDGNNTTTSECRSENTKEYTSYVKNDFPDQESLNPKLKYSNREKNLIKRQRYDEHLNSEHHSDGGVVYKKFDVNVTSDSEQKTSSPTIVTSPTSSTSQISQTSQTLAEDKTHSDASNGANKIKKSVKKVSSKKVVIKKQTDVIKKKAIKEIA